MLFVSMYVKFVVVDIRHMSFIFIPVCVLDLVPNLLNNDIVPPEENLYVKISLSYRVVFTDKINSV